MTQSLTVNIPVPRYFAKTSNKNEKRTRYSLLDSAQCRSSRLAFSIERFKAHNSCIPDLHPGRADSMAGNIRVIQ